MQGSGGDKGILGSDTDPDDIAASIERLRVLGLLPEESPSAVFPLLAEADACRRPATRPLAKAHDLYLTNSHPQVVYSKRAHKLLDVGVDGKRSVHIHALGRCIPRAVKLAHNLVLSFGSLVEVETSTRSVSVVDEAHHGGATGARSRTVSGISIRIWMKEIYC